MVARGLARSSIDSQLLDANVVVSADASSFALASWGSRRKRSVPSVAITRHAWYPLHLRFTRWRCTPEPERACFADTMEGDGLASCTTRLRFGVRSGGVVVVRVTKAVPSACLLQSQRCPHALCPSKARYESVWMPTLAGVWPNSTLSAIRRDLSAWAPLASPMFRRQRPYRPARCFKFEHCRAAPCIAMRP